MKNWLLGLMIALMAAGCRTASVNLAPVYQAESSPTLELQRGVGPILEASDLHGDRHLVAVRPFWSQYIDDSRQTTDSDLLWPLYWERQNPAENDRYGLLILYRRRENAQTHAAQSWFLPVYFHHVSPEGKDTFAIFPLGGTIVDFFGYDEVSFVLWPIYVSTRKGDTKSRAWLWPVFSKTEGDRGDKQRTFPFYGSAERQDGWENRFILWPFFHYATSTDPERPGGGWAFLPFYGRIDRSDPARGKFLHNRTVLWPFFSSLETESSSRLLAPWPFYQRALNYPLPGDDRRYVWPLWGRHNASSGNRWFVLWPIVHGSHAVLTDQTLIDRFYILPIYWSIDRQPPGGPLEQYRRIWPLWSVDRAGDDRCRVRVLDLWPVRQHTVIERNYAPFWTWYEYQRQGQRRQHDLLWGWWQYRHSPERVEKLSLFPFFSYRQDELGTASDFRLLTGLFGRERQGDATSTRWLWWFTFGGRD